MKDLKHLYRLEKLLEDSYPDMAREAREEGQIALGNVCSMIPEPLLNLSGCFGVRLRAPRTGSIEMGTYYMTSLLCETCRAILERAIEGGFQFLDGIPAPDACAQMNRCMENIEHLKLCNQEKFFITYADVPMKCDDTALAHYVRQMREYVLKPLSEVYGIDTGDKALREAVERLNQINEMLMQLSSYRKEEYPKITGYEFAVFCLASFCCPHEKLLPILQETLEEVDGREPDKKKFYRARVVVVGSEVDDPDLIRLMEEAGAFVVADRYCYGAFPGRERIALNEEEDVLLQICRHYMHAGQCPRFMNAEKRQQRREYVDQLAREYHADGIIYEQMKFCDYWGYERPFAGKVMRETYGYPVLSIDRPYVTGNSGQLRTRVQAFVESVEIKKLKQR